VGESTPPNYCYSGGKGGGVSTALFAVQAMYLNVVNGLCFGLCVGTRVGHVIAAC
jgi:hypothetical protein